MEENEAVFIEELEVFLSEDGVGKMVSFLVGMFSVAIVIVF